MTSFMFIFLLGFILNASSWKTKTFLAMKEVKVFHESQLVKSKFLQSSKLVLATAAIFSFTKPAALAAEEVVKKIKKPKVLETEIGIKYIELKKGSGPYPNPGDFVVINYSGFLTNGTAFDLTHSKKPLGFRLGQKQEITGLEDIIQHMQPGGEVTCTIPAKYAYGSKGVCVKDEGCLIPPDSDLRFAVKLISAGVGYN